MQASENPVDPDLLEKIAAEIAFYANQPPIEVARRVVGLLADLGYRIVPGGEGAAPPAAGPR